MMRIVRRFLCGRLFPCTLITLLVLAGAVALSLRLPALLAPVAAAERAFSLGTGLYVLSLPLVPEQKLARLLLLLFLPWTGAIFCLLRTRRPLPARPSGKTLRLEAGYAESAQYFADGTAFFAPFLRDAARAKRSIWLEYYIVARGALFDELFALLAKKAREGVDVRLIYDDFGCAVTLPRRFARELAARGIEAFAFRPLRLPTRGVTLRDHRKIAVFDGEIAYTGGINLADEYVGKKIRFGHWKDSAVRVTGAPAAQFARIFADTWNVFAPRTRSRIPPLPALERGNGTIGCTVFSDDAALREAREGAQLLCRLIASARRTLFLCTPYLAPDHALLSALKAAAAAGADVRLMLPHVPDKRAVFLVSRSYARELMRAGVRVREYTAGFLHAKSLVADGKTCVVSSYNLDFRSLFLQAECGACLSDEALAGALERDFSAMWEAGTQPAAAGAGEKLLAGVLRLFTPLI